MPCCLGGQRTWSATWYSHRHGQAGVGWVKGEWGKKRGAVHLGCQVGVDENFEVSNETVVVYFTELRETKTLFLASVAHVVYSSSLLLSGQPDLIPSPSKRIYITDIRLYKSCFPYWNSVTACRAQRLSKNKKQKNPTNQTKKLQEPDFHLLGIYGTLPYH